MKYNKINGLYSHDTEDNRIIRFSGDYSALDKIKKKLTIINRSVSFRLNQVNKSLVYYSSMNKSGRLDHIVDKLEKEKKELEKNAKIILYDEIEGEIYAPAGFWFLSENIPDNIKGNIKPYYIEGLRDYQKESVKSILKYKRSCLTLATGLGKSMIITSICLSLVKMGKRVCIVVPSVYLVNQMIETVSKYHDSVTGANSDKAPKPGCDILVTTAFSCKKFAEMYDVIIVDENHHSAANTWLDLLENIEHEYAYGLTATPYRSDGLDLVLNAFTGPSVYEKDTKWGIENGWLSGFDLVRLSGYSYFKSSKIILSDDVVRASAYKKIMDGDFLERIIPFVLKANSAGRKTMVVFSTLKAAHKMKKLLSNDIKCLVADSNFKKPLSDFQSGKSNILLATYKLIGEGVDIPFADTLFLLNQNRSEAINRQALGRVLRKHPDKKKPLVFDCCTKGYKSFENAFEERLKIFSEIADSVSEYSI